MIDKLNKIKSLFTVAFTSVLMLIAVDAFSQTTHIELQQMADADQQARSIPNINWTILNKEDSLRRARVFVLIKEGKIVTAKDHFNLGIIFQHGNDTIASSMAVKGFKRALELDSTLNRWWYAAAVDRDLMRRNLPQVYGTQFIQNAVGKWIRYQIDPSKISDEQRKYYSVETLADQVEKERLMNLKPISVYYAETQSIDATLAQIKEQFEKGSLSAYNSSEQAINSFGYELMNKNLNNEALRVFELIIKFYPESYNAFDSYGEGLMKVGRKKAAVKAYKKSLKLNPDNENAKQILKAKK